MTRRTRLIIFAAACFIALALPLVYIGMTRRAAAARTTPSGKYGVLERLAAGRHGVLFRSTVPDESFGKIAFAPLGEPDARWEISNVTCDRVYFQHGRGVCEAIESGLIPPYVVFVFDEHFSTSPKRPLGGVPSRARISPDGRWAALTVFQSGHSYADGGFSTGTYLLDAATGQPMADLEMFDVFRDGQPFDAVDFNFWGVTFADGNRFYATLQTAGERYLIEGDVDKRQARVLRPGVECPSLSPDGRRLAFKKRVEGNVSVFWNVAVLDLTTMEETLLGAETRSVDDQVDWLDNEHVVYHLPRSGGADVWSLRVDRPEAPALLIRGGYSPSVVR